MKSIVKFLITLVAVAFFASCNKDVLDNNEVSVPAGKHEVSLTVNSKETRVAIDDVSGDLAWEAGDVITVKYSNGQDYEFQMKGGVSTGTATFKGYIPEDVYNNCVPYFVFYYGNPESQDLSIQNNFVKISGKYSLKGCNVKLVGPVDNPGSKDNFSATIRMGEACMFRVAKDKYKVKSEVVGGKTNHYVKVDFSYLSAFTDTKENETYKINNIKVDGTGKPAEDLTFFATNTTLSYGQEALQAKVIINDDLTNPFHTSFNGNTNDPLAVVTFVLPSRRYMLTHYTWAVINEKNENRYEVIKCEDNTMTWAQYAATNTKIQIDGDDVKYEFDGIGTKQLYYDKEGTFFFMYPVKSTDKVSDSDGLTIITM